MAQDTASKKTKEKSLMHSTFVRLAAVAMLVLVALTAAFFTSTRTSSASTTCVTISWHNLTSASLSGADNFVLTAHLQGGYDSHSTNIFCDEFRTDASLSKPSVFPSGTLTSRLFVDGQSTSTSLTIRETAGTSNLYTNPLFGSCGSSQATFDGKTATTGSVCP